MSDDPIADFKAACVVMKALIVKVSEGTATTQEKDTLLAMVARVTVGDPAGS